MRIFWWQGGLQIQPESDVETEALLVLMQNVKYERPAETDAPQRASTDASTGSCARGLDIDLG